MKAVRSLTHRIFDRVTADDSPASYYFVCGVAALILGDTLAILGYEIIELARVCGIALVHAATLTVF